MVVGVKDGFKYIVIWPCCVADWELWLAVVAQSQERG